jgi:hypothetical protein
VTLIKENGIGKLTGMEAIKVAGNALKKVSEDG